MKRSKLIQRLSIPEGDVDAFGDNPYVGAGPVLNWGISQESMKALRGVVVFDYMGAAEFEWGAIEKAMRLVADHRMIEELMGFVITIPLREVERTFFDEENEPPDGDGTVWVICRKEDANEVSRRIRAWAKNDVDRFGKHDCDPEWYLLETTRLNAALRPNPVWPSKICGWFELDNGFFFFTEEKMYNRVMKLFGLESKG